MTSVRGWVLSLFVVLSISYLGFSETEPFLPNSTLSVEDTVAVALKNQPDLKSAEQNVKAALMRTRQAKSPYWPEIDLSSQYLRGNYQTFAGPFFQLITSNYTTYILNFAASLTVEDFGRRFAKQLEASAQLSQAQASYHDTKTKIIYNTAAAYFKLMEAKRLEGVYLELLHANERHLKLAEAFVRTGEKPKLELVKAQASYADARFKYLKSKEDLANATAELNSAMGLSNPPGYSIAEDLTIPQYNEELATAKATAFRIRPDLRVAHARVEEAASKLNEMRANRYPTISANALFGWVGPTYFPGNQVYTLGGTLTWPLFQGNLITHEINEAIANKDSFAAQEQSVFLQANKEIEVNYRSFVDAKERLDVAKEELKDAQESFRLAEASYKVGLTTQLELSDAEASLAQAEEHQVSAITDLRISLSALKRSIGLEEP